jgi:DNA-binding transcriptional MocR family regulator
MLLLTVAKTAVLDYGDAAGHRRLREVVARRMRVRGVSVSADEVLITGGAQDA